MLYTGKRQNISQSTLGKNFPSYRSQQLKTPHVCLSHIYPSIKVDSKQQNLNKDKF